MTSKFPSDLPSGVMADCYRKYADRESANRALGVYHDDVVLSGMITYISAKVKPVRSKKNPAWEGFDTRDYKIVLDAHCIQDMIDKWGPDSNGHVSRPSTVGFIEREDGGYLPVLHSQWNKNTKEDLDAAFPDGDYPVSPPITPLIAGAQYTFEIDVERAEGAHVRQFACVVGARASASYAAPSIQYPTPKAFYNLGGKSLTAFGQLDPSTAMSMLKRLKIVCSDVPMFDSARDRRYWHGPHFVVCISVNNTPGEASMCRIMGMPDDMRVSRVRTRYDEKSIYAGAPTDRDMAEVKKLIADTSDKDSKERAKWSLTNLVAGQIDRNIKALDDHEDLVGCYMVVSGSFMAKSKTDDNKEMGVTYTQMGMSCAINLPTNWDSLHPEVEGVTPLATIHTRLYPRALRPLGVMSFECWANLIPYFTYLKFDMIAWVDNRRTMELAVNSHYTRLTSDVPGHSPSGKIVVSGKVGDDSERKRVSYSGILDGGDDEVSEEEEEEEATPGKEGDDGEALEEEYEPMDEDSAATGSRFLTCTAYNATPYFIECDPRVFYNKTGFSATREIAEIVHARAASALVDRIDSVCQEFIPLPLAKTGAAKGKKVKISLKDLKKAKKLVARSYNDFTAEVMAEHGIICVSEGSENTRNIFTDPKVYEDRVHRTVVLPFFDNVSPFMLELFQEITPELGDIFVDFIAGPLLQGKTLSDKAFDAYRKKTHKAWTADEGRFGPLLDVVKYAGGPQTVFIPAMVPLVVLIMESNEDWDIGLASVIQHYGASIVYGLPESAQTEDDDDDDDDDKTGKKRGIDHASDDEATDPYDVEEEKEAADQTPKKKAKQ